MKEKKELKGKDGTPKEKRGEKEEVTELKEKEEEKEEKRGNSLDSKNPKATPLDEAPKEATASTSTSRLRAAVDIRVLGARGTQLEPSESWSAAGRALKLNSNSQLFPAVLNIYSYE